MEEIVASEQAPQPIMSLMNICTALKDRGCIISASPTYSNYLALDSQDPRFQCLPDNLMYSIYLRRDALRDAYLQRAVLYEEGTFPSSTYREDIHQFLLRLETQGVTFIVDNGDFHGFRENAHLAQDTLEFIRENRAAMELHLKNN